MQAAILGSATKYEAQLIPSLVIYGIVSRTFCIFTAFPKAISSKPLGRRQAKPIQAKFIRGKFLFFTHDITILVTFLTYCSEEYLLLYN